MTYITLDLEWNQAYQQKALAVQKRLECRLRGEVIQIGAVKMDEHMTVIGSYRITVKPRFFKNIQKHVARLTGIDQEMADHGIPLAEAIERFHRWCGTDFVFLTWGPDDIPMLEDNLRANRLDSAWLENTGYDLQVIFNRQTDGGKTQKSLEYAMEYFSLEQNLPAHDALNDAYFTALVAQKLDVPGGVATYGRETGEYLFSAVYGDADAGERGFAEPDDILKLPTVCEPVCPLCGKKLPVSEKMLHSKGQKYTLLLHCAADGDLFLKLRLTRNFNETWRAKCVMLPATEDGIEDYRRRLTEAENAVRRRRPRRGGGRGKPTPPAAE